MNTEELTSWESLETFGLIPENTKVVKGDPIFPRLDMKEEVEYIKEKMQGSAPAPAAEEKKVPEKPDSEEITIDDFMKLDLRVAEVISAEPVKKADKLLKLQLDLGYEKRQVVSGIAKFISRKSLSAARLSV